jgi:hypothetical protein
MFYFYQNIQKSRANLALFFKNNAIAEEIASELEDMFNDISDAFSLKSERKKIGEIWDKM